MYALFEDSGKFLAGRVLSQAEASLQIELDSGKRMKVKSAHVLLRFEQPTPPELLSAATELAQEIDLNLAWEFAPEGEFSFVDFAREYFSDAAGLPHQAAALLRLFEAPHYFRRMGKGQFRKAPQETVQAALLGIERKRQQALQVEAWAAALMDAQCPDPVREQLYRILFKPDKNSPEYKAVVLAARQSQKGPLDLLKSAGALDSPYQFHWKRFLFEHFPQGTQLPALAAPEIRESLPLSSARAFSIDDSQTTEIDDALSVQGLGSGVVVLGIHIAAPGLALLPDSPLDRVARDRLSTVYMPGWKLTMLPRDVVQAYTLTEGRECPAVSLYVSFNEDTLELLRSETRIERVWIDTNLRHDQLDAIVTEASLTGEESAHYPHADALAFTFRLARHLKAGREAVRGKPETFNRPDYNFRLQGNDSEPVGDEIVSISERRRGEPLDLIVAEAMILANSTWGRWLAELGVPGIYRSQASLLPGVKVRMGTKALPHAGMGVTAYAWSTSPLRRYVDLVNQWQIIACVRHGPTAALAAPFKPKDAQLFAVISSFDATYTAYNEFQRVIERFWTLRWLEQQQVKELDAVVLRDGMVRAEKLPLVFGALQTESLPRGSRVRVRLTATDLLTLDVFSTLVAQRDGDEASPVAAEDLEEEGAPAGPLALAIDIGAGEGEAEAAPAA